MNNSPFLKCFVETRFVILLDLPRVSQQQLYLHESTTNLSFNGVGRDTQFEGKDSALRTLLHNMLGAETTAFHHHSQRQEGMAIKLRRETRRHL